MSLPFLYPPLRSLRFSSSVKAISAPILPPHHFSVIRLASTKNNSTNNSVTTHSTTSDNTATATRITHYPSLNPPSSTLPPLLVLPVRSATTSLPRHYLATGKAYLTFYKAGLLAVWHNLQRTRAITAALPPALSSSPDAAVAQRVLSRADWQLLRRSRADVARLPLFAVVVLVCGEFTPLVVLFLAGVVPRTCRVPRQIQGERERSERRRGQSFRNGTLEAGDKMAATSQTTSTEGLSDGQMAHIGKSLGLYSSTWDRLSLAPMALLRPRVKRALDYLEVDDQAIEDFGGVEKMEMEEVRISLEERGVDVLGKSDVQLRGLLQDWLNARNTQSRTRLLLTRPSIWAGTR